MYAWTIHELQRLLQSPPLKGRIFKAEERLEQLSEATTRKIEA
jgi:hypothetical protein